MTLVQAIREPDACPRCYGIHSRNDGLGTAKVPPEHLKAICWAYLCDACAEIVVASVQTSQEGRKA